jgi:hypothetical protein
MRPISKITRAKWTGGVTQVIEYLLCKREALSSNPTGARNKKRKKRKEGREGGRKEERKRKRQGKNTDPEWADSLMKFNKPPLTRGNVIR